ncbi:T-cell surface glycoprotein CD3 epsilon chain [Tyto alba]|uniref:T-cell surface glycoprotein CD3 epsilon chain n=1 Tax=Tyto alba TaxID=56313 RepID=UPI001401D325|nr:T-cell surface glycoprotein CD3 epsilon chain [Tyto alba]XP_032862634.1 T-cell surface glycoprotein CD3 epsilon chain [Tyto alba]XP_032862702.1 T-cell surface glycoprotein CD3 epsilon chain [Tyto alba]XP_032862778.1 T-cell surface glycoprotein CD3 epsilon chain [Tyto alba]
MRLERALPLLGLLLCGVGTAAQEGDTEAEEEFLVEISGTTVTITCPLTEGSIDWELAGTKQTFKERKYVIENHDSSPASVSCSSSVKKHEMYLNARVCANCEELDALAVTGIIAADLLITFGVLILVYYFSKDRKGRASAGAGSRPRGQKMQRPPPVPNPDYEPIRKGQREVYAGLESRGF